MRSHDDLRQAVDIEFGEDGSLRLFAGRVTGHVDSAQRSAIYDDLVAAYAIGLVALAREFADQIGYRGPWQFGIAVTGLKSLSATAWSAFGGSGPVYDRDDYRRTAGATRPQIDKPYVVAGALIRPLLRSLGTVRHTGRFLEPTDS